MKAKTISLIGQIIMSVWIAGWTAFAFITAAPIAMADIVLSGSCIAASFSPVYVNILIDTIKGKKKEE